MDKMEKRIDSMRKDENAGKHGEEENADDKARKDAAEAAEKEAKEKAEREDRMRKDAAEAAEKAERDDKARKDAETREDSIRKDIRRLDETIATLPKAVTDADYAVMADEQARADAVYGGFGERAPAPLQGETTAAYRIRLAKGLQKHSKAWANVVLKDLPVTALDVATQQIYADAVVAARSPDGVPVGQLRPIRRSDASGRQITEFVGDPSAWMSDFRTPPRSIAKPFFRPRQQMGA